jgi:hypothetical protein
MIDDEINGHERFDELRIASHACDRRTHRGEVN